MNGHFNNSDQSIINKRTSDPPMPKKVKKDQKKTKVRRQPWSGKCNELSLEFPEIPWAFLRMCRMFYEIIRCYWMNRLKIAEKDE